MVDPQPELAPSSAVSREDGGLCREQERGVGSPAAPPKASASQE